MKTIATLLALACTAAWAQAAPADTDRVYTADQNSNTVSVINPASHQLLGQIRLGNLRPDVLSPLYRGQINVHGLGFSPDHKTLVVVSNGSNSVSFVDTASNTVKGIAYIGRSPHEAFFTADGKEVWAVVRGEDYISVIDPLSFKEKRRIATADGPGMVQFTPDGKLAFVVSSFTPEVDIIDVASYSIIKRIKVTSPFSPFLQFTPDFKEVWMTHKDVGKVTRIDVRTQEVKGVIDTGLITNHLAFGKKDGVTYAYVTVGGENLVKVYTTGDAPKLVASIPVGALPHGAWPSDDFSRIYVGLENGDGVEVIDVASNKVTAHIPVGQAPQALVYLSHVAADGAATPNLKPRANGEPLNIALHSSGAATGFVVARNLGVLDTLELTLFKLKPETRYSIYVSGQTAPVATVETNAKGMANTTAIGPLRQASQAMSSPASTIAVMEGDALPGQAAPVLSN
jgi:YVTN family beta-propeller protein